MDLVKICEVLESFCKSESLSNIQQLKHGTDLVHAIIQNLTQHHTHQLSDPVYSSLFELYQQHSTGGHQFVLQFVPVLVWTYLSATTRRDEQAYGKLEALLLAIYNSEVLDDVGEQKMYRFRLPSLSRPSIYHEPYQGLAPSSTLTETALSRHEQSEMAVPLPGHGKQLSRITASHRQAVLSAILNQYNAKIAFMMEVSHRSFCIMALKLAKCGFYKLCLPSKEESKEKPEVCFSTEELTKLINHPRITLSNELIQEITQGLYFLMYNGQRILATKALENLHWRTAHSLLAPAHMLTNAIKHSLEQTGGVRHDGLLGLEMYLSDQQSQPTQAGSVPTVTSHTLEPPAKAGNIVALTTKGLKMTPFYHTAANETVVEDIEIQDIPTNYSCSSEKSTQVTKKTHKKSQSTGYFRLPFLMQKGDMQLNAIPGKSALSSGSAKRFSSEISIGSNRVDCTEGISGSFSLSEDVLDHKL